MQITLQAVNRNCLAEVDSLEDVWYIFTSERHHICGELVHVNRAVGVYNLDKVRLEAGTAH